MKIIKKSTAFFAAIVVASAQECIRGKRTKKQK